MKKGGVLDCRTELVILSVISNSNFDRIPDN